MAAASITCRNISIAPADLPPDLIWFKWEAYLTWVTGFLLLIVQYLFQCHGLSSSILPSCRSTPWQAIAISVAARRRLVHL